MAAPAIPAIGTTIEIDAVGGSTPTTIAGIIGITNINSTDTPVSDVSTLASTRVEVMAGLADEGQFDAMFNWNLDDTGQAEAQAAWAASTQKKFIITFPSTSPSVTLNVATFNGYVLKFQMNEASVSGISLKGTMTIRINGAITWS